MAGFINKISVRAIANPGDGKNWILAEPLIYVRKNGDWLRAPEGMPTDGPSIPPELEGIIHPHGAHYGPALMHDSAYADYLERLEAGIWQPYTLPKVDCDLLFEEAMEVNGVEAIPRNLIFEGVHFGGHEAFATDRAAAAARGPRTRNEMDSRRADENAEKAADSDVFSLSAPSVSLREPSVPAVQTPGE